MNDTLAWLGCNAKCSSLLSLITNHNIIKSSYCRRRIPFAVVGNVTYKVWKIRFLVVWHNKNLRSDLL